MKVTTGGKPRKQMSKDEQIADLKKLCSIIEKENVKLWEQVKNLTIPVVIGCKFVKSRFRARWSGVVIDKKNRTKQNPLYLILILKDSNGNTPRKRIVKTLDSSWVIEIDKIELGGINKDWFNKLPTL